MDLKPHYRDPARDQSGRDSLRRLLCRALFCLSLRPSCSGPMASSAASWACSTVSLHFLHLVGDRTYRNRARHIRTVTHHRTGNRASKSAFQLYIARHSVRQRRLRARHRNSIKCHAFRAELSHSIRARSATSRSVISGVMMPSNWSNACSAMR